MTSMGESQCGRLSSSLNSPSFPLYLSMTSLTDLPMEMIDVEFLQVRRLLVMRPAKLMRVNNYNTPRKFVQLKLVLR